MQRRGGYKTKQKSQILEYFMTHPDEHLTAAELTQAMAEDGTPIGLCQAQDMYYVTTSGGYIGDCNFGFEYVNALCKLYGIENSHFVSAQGLDLEGADVAAIMEQATMQDF